MYALYYYFFLVQHSSPVALLENISNKCTDFSFENPSDGSNLKIEKSNRSPIMFYATFSYNSRSQKEKIIFANGHFSFILPKGGSMVLNYSVVFPVSFLQHAEGLYFS